MTSRISALTALTTLLALVLGAGKAAPGVSGTTAPGQQR